MDNFGDMFNNFEGRDRSKTIKKLKVSETELESSFKIIDELKQSVDISEKSKGKIVLYYLLLVTKFLFRKCK